MANYVITIVRATSNMSPFQRAARRLDFKKGSNAVSWISVFRITFCWFSVTKNVLMSKKVRFRTGNSSSCSRRTCLTVCHINWFSAAPPSPCPELVTIVAAQDVLVWLSVILTFLNSASVAVLRTGNSSRCSRRTCLTVCHINWFSTAPPSPSPENCWTFE